MSASASAGTGPAGDLRVAWLGHATVVVDLDGVRLVADPLLGRNAGLLRRRGTRPEASLWEGSQAVLLSHLHHDHAELSSLRALSGVPVYTGSGNARWLRRKGVPAMALPDPEEVGDEDGWIPVTGSVEVRLTRADHRHRPMPFRPNDTHGHLLRGRSHGVWLAGDTSLYPELATVANPLRRPLDLAIVPIAGWGPRLSPGHLDPEAAARACALTRARWALPVHWGTLHAPGMRWLGGGWMDRPHAEFAAALAQSAPACRLVPLLPGEVWQPPEDPG